MSVILLLILLKTMANNGSIYLHVFMTEHGRSPNPFNSDSHSKQHTFSSFKSNFSFV
jgi:hypothetical protein